MSIDNILAGITPDTHCYVDNDGKDVWCYSKRALRAAVKQELAARVPKGWDEAYAAFKGAFDTPLARRKDDSEFANDARRRMRDFNDAMLAAAAAAHQPAQQADDTALLQQALEALKGVDAQDKDRNFLNFDEWCRLDAVIAALNARLNPKETT